MQPTAHREVSDLLAKLKVTAQSSPRFQEISDQIETITLAYMLPTVEDIEFDMHLGMSERRLLECLFLRRDKTLSRDMLMNAIYYDRGADEWPHIKIVDVFVCKLRTKFLRSPQCEHWIETVRGRGFRYVKRELVQ